MTVTVYKLTDANMCTRDTQWEVGVPSPTINGRWLWHAYESPLIAVLADPVHAKFGPTARIFRAEAPGIARRSSWAKCGVHQITLVEELPLPIIITAARIRVAIALARRLPQSQAWIDWADGWIAHGVESADVDETVAWAVVEAANAKAATAAAWAAVAASKEALAAAKSEVSAAWAAEEIWSSIAKAAARATARTAADAKLAYKTAYSTRSYVGIAPSTPPLTAAEVHDIIEEVMTD